MVKLAYSKNYLIIKKHKLIILVLQALRRWRLLSTQKQNTPSGFAAMVAYYKEQYLICLYRLNQTRNN